MDALILAGGLGTRLASVVADRAKPVATIAGRPFVAYLLDHIARCDEIRRVVLCVGHKAETVEAALGTHHGRLELAYSREPRPLGTGGALRRALLRGVSRAPVLAFNGDTLFTLEVERLIAFHRENHANATMALARVPDASRFGTVRVRNDRVEAFEEKGRSGPGWINAGAYVLGKSAIDSLTGGPIAFSLEHDLLPKWLGGRRLAGLRSRARFIDIGIPEDYARAEQIFGGRDFPQDPAGAT